MPATAGRVRMPANNRVHSSAALQTHGIWQSAIGYDPYAPNKEENKGSSESKSAEPEGENAYASFQGLLALARITGSNANEARGACKKCGRVGHLTFQCRNFLSVKDDKDKDADEMQANVLAGLDKLKASVGRVKKKASDESEEESEEESEDSDSSEDSEMERIIGQRQGKRVSSKSKSSRKKKDLSDDDKGPRSRERKERGRSKKRRSERRSRNDSDDDDDSRRKRRKEKRRKRDESSDEDEEDRHRRRRDRKEKRRRRRSRHYSDDSEGSPRPHKAKSRRAAPPADSDGTDPEHSNLGRVSKHTEKKSRK
ncbi:hypothetical protein Dimus_009134 [Dionaea muscipula]